MNCERNNLVYRLLKDTHRITLRIALSGLFVLLIGFSSSSQSTNPLDLKLSSGLALSPPSPRLPGGYLSMGVELPHQDKFGFSGEVTMAYMQKIGYDIEDFTEYAFVIDIDLGVDFRKSKGPNTFGILVGPVLRHYKGRSISDKNTLGNEVIWFEVRDVSSRYFGYHIGGFWDYQFREKMSIGIRYKAFVFFDEFSNHTLGVTLKRIL